MTAPQSIELHRDGPPDAPTIDFRMEGACDGECACSTCHLILEQRAYDALEPPTEDELDMLDMAYEVKDTSRLGCQDRVTRELNDTRFALPETDWLP